MPRDVLFAEDTPHAGILLNPFYSDEADLSTEKSSKLYHGTIGDNISKVAGYQTYQTCEIISATNEEDPLSLRGQVSEGVFEETRQTRVNRENGVSSLEKKGGETFFSANEDIPRDKVAAEGVTGLDSLREVDTISKNNLSNFGSQIKINTFLKSKFSGIASNKIKQSHSEESLHSTSESFPHSYVTRDRRETLKYVSEDDKFPKNISNRANSWLSWFKTPGANLEIEGTGHTESSLVELQKVSQKDFIGSTMISGPDTDRYGFYHTSKLITRSQPVVEKSSSHEVNVRGTESFSYTSEYSLIRQTQPAISQATNQYTSQEIAHSIDTLKKLGNKHDKEHQHLLEEWSMLILRISKAQTRHLKDVANDSAMFGYKAYKLRNSDQEWSWVSTNKNHSKPKEFLYKDLLILSFRGGFPSKFRNQLWYELSGASAQAIPGEFDRLLRVSQNTSESGIRKHIREIDSDLHRTLASNKYFFDQDTLQPGPHFEILKHVLYAFVTHDTHIGYSQGMNHILGNLILGICEGSKTGTTWLGAEDMFWIFVALIDDMLPRYAHKSYYHQESLAFIHIDVSITIHHYLQMLSPGLFMHLMNLQVELEIIVLGWWIGLFTDTLGSLDLWFVMVDGLMLAQYPELKLIAYTLTIFKNYEKKLISVKSRDEVYAHFRKLKSGICANVHPVAFSSTCFSFDKKLKISDLIQLRKKFGNEIM